MNNTVVPFRYYYQSSGDQFLYQAEQAMLDLISDLFRSKNGLTDTVKNKVGYPKTDIVVPKDGGSIVFEIAVPGFKQEDIEIVYERGTLIVKGKAKEKAKYEKEEYVAQEMTHRSFARSWTLSEEAVKTDEITANIEDGILRIVVPRVEPKKIEVQQRKQIAVQ